MKRLSLLVLICLLFSINSYAQQQYIYQLITPSLTATGSGTSANIIASGAAFHNLTWYVSGTVSGCSVRVDSSVDGITWNVGDVLPATTCTSDGSLLSASIVVNYVRINLVTLTGAGATFVANLTGFITNPVSGGSSTPAFPLTVSGTVNSGGVPYFSGATTESSSAALTQFGVIFGGGAGGAPTSSAQGAANMPLLGNGAANPVFSTIAYPTSLNSGGWLYASSTTQIASGPNITVNKLVKAGGAGTAPAASTITDGILGLTTDTNFFTGANTVRLTANATAITALTPGTVVLTTGALPVSTNLSFHCHVLYNQQTAAVAGTGFAIQGATNAPTRLDAWANMFTSNAGVQVEGSVVNLATTTATSLVTGTPSAITTVFIADINGSVQVGASATTLNLLAFTGNASDSITIQAGSYCSVTP